MHRMTPAELEAAFVNILPHFPKVLTLHRAALDGTIHLVGLAREGQTEDEPIQKRGEPAVLPAGYLTHPPAEHPGFDKLLAWACVAIVIPPYPLATDYDFLIQLALEFDHALAVHAYPEAIEPWRAALEAAGVPVTVLDPELRLKAAREAGELV